MSADFNSDWFSPPNDITANVVTGDLGLNYIFKGKHFIVNITETVRTNTKMWIMTLIDVDICHYYCIIADVVLCDLDINFQDQHF